MINELNLLIDHLFYGFVVVMVVVIVLNEKKKRCKKKAYKNKEL